jgi:signal transduction histidine kinase
LLEATNNTLERLDRSKSDFIAVAAHELKTPLTLIDGYSSMVRERFEGQKEETDIILMLDGIGNGTRRLREIIDDMIDVSKIDNDLLMLNFQPVWIDRIISSVCDEFQEVVAKRQLDFVFRKFQGINELTFGDGERLCQVFRNIISNAVKFTPDGGKILVSGKKLPGFIEITVDDSGIGIDPKDQRRIFEKFSKLGDATLHSSGKTKFKGGGPGLGLAIAKGIIEAHGGAIWVESEGYDEIKLPGSIFHVLLPVRSKLPDYNLTKLFNPMTSDPLVVNPQG